jgi:hypothetical protein
MHCRTQKKAIRGTWSEGRWAEGMGFFLLLPLFFLKMLLFFSFLAASFREKKRRVWKDLQTGYKT